MIAEALAGTEQSPQFVAAGSCDSPGLIRGSGKLVQIAPDHGELGGSSPERLQLVLRQWNDAAKMCTYYHRDVGRARHPTRSRTSLQQQLIFWNQADHQPCRSWPLVRHFRLRHALRRCACTLQRARDQPT